MKNNKVSSTSQRLKQIMTEKNLRQIDLMRLVKPYCEKYGVTMNKSSISQFVNGKNVPLQDKLFVLALALGVSEGWLMGYDVPRERLSDPERFAVTAAIFNTVFNEERKHIEIYRKLNGKNREKVNKLTRTLLEAQNAEKEILMAAHQRTDIEASSEDKKHDEDMMKDNF